jgi:hypothetical protein
MICEPRSTLRRALRAAAVVALLVPLSVSSPAGAATESERLDALRELKEGNRLFDGGDYLGALARFERAYVKVPSPKLFFNLAQAHRKLGHSVEALELYERFLAEATDAAAGLRDEAQRRVAELAKSVATIDVRADVTGAEVSVDGKSCGTTPLARGVRVTPGSHQVVVQAGDRKSPPHVERIVAAAGQQVVVVAHLGSGGTGGSPDATPAAATPPSAPGAGGARATTSAGGDARAAAVAPATSPGAAAATTVAQRSDAGSAPGGHGGRLSLMVRADVDRELAGAGLFGALGYGLTEQLQAFAGGFVWPAGGLNVPGASLGITVHLTRGALRPFLSVEAQGYFRSGAHLGAHGAAGLEYDIGRHAGLFAAVGAQYTSSVIVSGERSVFFVPSAGMRLRF